MPLEENSLSSTAETQITVNSEKDISENMKISNVIYIGAGYVGAVNSIVMAYKCPDIKVTSIDLNNDLINAWNSDNIPIKEPKLKEMYLTVKGINMEFSNSLAKCCREADIIFICVNTPTMSHGTGKGRGLDTKNIEKAAVMISEACVKSDVIVVEKSTVPVKSAEKISQILKLDTSRAYHVISNPEFLSEGNAVNNSLYPDRVLIGSGWTYESQMAAKTLKKLYARWVPVDKIILMNTWSAELSKLVSNAFLAQRISSINSITEICEKTGANISEIANAIGLDSRIGPSFLSPSLGFGGSCFEKDILCLVYLCEHLGLNVAANYWHSILKVNYAQKKRFLYMIVSSMHNDIYGKKICVYGVTFKANTSDFRESSALYIIKKLIKAGAQVNIYDPGVNQIDIANHIKNNFIYPFEKQHDAKVHSCPYDASKGCEAIVIATEWNAFKKLDFGVIYKYMTKPAYLFDGRILLDSRDLISIGFKVYSIGSYTSTFSN